MALRPIPIPTWALSSYGNDDLAWDEAKRQCRAALHEWCRQGDPHPYLDVIARVTAIAWPAGDHTGAQLGYLLGQVSLEELSVEEDRPVMSSVVIASGRNEPSHGYWAFLENDLGIRVPQANRERFWLRELARCFEIYGRDS
jgi:hypothetical protein